MRLPPYSTYKPSGVEWLGDVPAHWDVERSDTRVTTMKRQVTPEFFSGVEVMHYSIPVVQELGTGAVENGEDIASAKQLIDGPVVLVSRLNPRKATICRASPHGSHLTLASTEFVALKPTTGDIRFLEYLVSSELFRQRLDSWVQSVTRSHQRARPEEIYRFWNAWPDSDEQTAIADFLDRETAKIDTLVAKKRTLIERLKEKRTALISRTVTRGLPPDAARAAGLDPHPKLKPSGIDWLGDVPEHWDVRRLKDAGNLYGGAGFPHEYQGVPDEELPFYKVGDLALAPDGKTLTVPVNSISRATAAELRARVIPKDAVVYAKIGAALFLNRRRLTPAECCIDNNMTAFVPRRSRLSPEWAFHWMSTLNFGEFANPGAVPSLSEGYQATLPLLLPPLAEQPIIADFLDGETAKIDAMVAKVETAIERLQEYRTALITAAVTGKIDVRRAVA